MPMTAQELAKEIGAKVKGDKEQTVGRCAALTDADADDLAYLPANAALDQLKACKAGIVIVAKGIEAAGADRTLLIADDPYLAFAKALVVLQGHRLHPPPGIHPQAYVDGTAVVGELCTIRPFVYIAPRVAIGRRCVIYPSVYIGKDVTIGDDCVIFSNATIYDRTVIGNRAVIHASSVIGGDGMAYARDIATGQHIKPPHAGFVQLMDDVEIGSHASVERALVGVTRIGNGVKINNRVTIRSGTVVADNTLVTG